MPGLISILIEISFFVFTDMPINHNYAIYHQSKARQCLAY